MSLVQNWDKPVLMYNRSEKKECYVISQCYSTICESLPLPERSAPMHNDPENVYFVMIGVIVLFMNLICCCNKCPYA